MAARSERRVETVAVLRERDAPEIEVDRLERLTISRDGKLLQVRDHIAAPHVDQRCARGKIRRRIRIAADEDGHRSASSIRRHARATGNSLQRDLLSHVKARIKDLGAEGRDHAAVGGKAEAGAFSEVDAFAPEFGTVTNCSVAIERRKTDISVGAIEGGT